MPGVGKENVKVEIEGDVLTVYGYRSEAQSSDRDRWHVLERDHGDFQRRLRLPNYLKTEKATASYKDGLLSVTVPKQQSRRPVVQQVRATSCCFLVA